MFHLQITKNHVDKLSKLLESGLHLFVAASPILDRITIQSILPPRWGWWANAEMPVKAEEQKTCRWQSSWRQWGKRVVDCKTDLIEKELENDARCFKGENNLLSWIFPVQPLCRGEMWKQANYCLSFTLLVRNKRGKEAHQCFLYLLTMKTFVSFLWGLWVRIILSKVAIRSIWKALKISVSESKPAQMKRYSFRDGWDWRLEGNRKYSPVFSHE